MSVGFRWGVDGPIVGGLENRFPEALSWLRSAGTGDVPGVLSHPELGERKVDLIFGTPNYGVNHIDIEHPGDLDKLPESWSSMLVKGEGPSRIVMQNSDQVRAVIPKVREDTPKNWLLTYYDKNMSDRPGGKSFDSASAQDRAVPFPDRPVNANVVQDLPLLNAARGPGSVALSRTVSSAFGGINPLNAKAPQQQPDAGRPLGIFSGQPMPQWPFPPPIWDRSNCRSTNNLAGVAG